MMISQVIVREREIAAHSPLYAPGITDNEPALGIIVTHRENSMTADDLLVPGGHSRAAGPCDLLRMQAFVNGKSEHEWIARRKAGLQLAEDAPNAIVTDGGMFRRFHVTSPRRPVPKLSLPIPPQVLGAN